MADKIKLKAKLRGSAPDKAMAAFAAASVAFATFVMPAELLARLVTVGSQTGRAAVSAGAAFVTFLGVFLLLRALDRRPHRSKAAEVPSEPPRLRRADMHPDAPARTPILARRELGVPLDDMPVDERTVEPADLEKAENVDYNAEWQRPLPGFIEHEVDKVDTSPATEAVAPAPEDSAPAPEEAQPAPAQPAGEADLPFWVPEEASPDEVVEEIESGGTAAEEAAADTPPSVPFWVEEPEAGRPPVEEVPLAAPEPASDEPAPELNELAERLPKKEALEEESIDGLVERFETGVGRRKRSGRTARAAKASSEDEKLQERLRGAISDLRKISRG